MMLYIDSHAKEKATFPGKQCIIRYDWSKKAWEHVSTFGDKALFVNDQDFEIATIDTMMDMRNIGVSSNKIYYLFDGGYLIYSVKNGELVEFKSIISSNPLENGGDLH